MITHTPKSVYKIASVQQPVSKGYLSCLECICSPNLLAQPGWSDGFFKPYKSWQFYVPQKGPLQNLSFGHRNTYNLSLQTRWCTVCDSISFLLYLDLKKKKKISYPRLETKLAGFSTWHWYQKIGDFHVPLHLQSRDDSMRGFKLRAVFWFLPKWPSSNLSVTISRQVDLNQTQWIQHRWKELRE